MAWTCTPFTTDAAGKETVFPYEHWEEQTRPDIAQAPAGENLWQPVFIALTKDEGAASPTYEKAAKALPNLADPTGFIVSQEALSALTILADPGGHSDYADDMATLSHLIVYRSGATAKTELIDAEGNRIFDILHVGAAIPRAFLRPVSEDAQLTPKTKNPINSGVVLTAVVDDVIGIANQRFRATPTTTRIAHFWKQELEAFQKPLGDAEVVIGQTYTKSRIDDVLRKAPTEAAFYRTLYQTQEMRRFRALWKEAVDVAGRIINDERDVDMDKASILLAAFVDKLPEYFPGFLETPSDNGLRRVDILSVEFLTSLLSSSIKFLFRDYDRRIDRLDAHGTAMLDIAAGFDLDSALNDQRPLVAVQLPSLATLETSGARLDPYILQAVQRILYWADNHGEEGQTKYRVPVVINLSYGITAGPKDGYGLLEREIQRLVDNRNREVPTVVVLPAGNTYRSLLSGAVTIDEDERRSIEWQVLPNDFSPSYLEMRVPLGSQWTLGFTAPGEDAVELDHTAFASGIHAYNDTEKGASRAIYVKDDPNAQSTLIVVALAPTMNFEQPRHRTQHGTYRVALRNKGTLPIEVRYDVQRDDTPIGYPLLGRQSYLDDIGLDGIDPVTKTRRLPMPASKVRFDETLNAFAGPQDSMMVLVGGTYADSNRPQVNDPEAREPSLYSSSGIAPRQPDLSAISEQGRSLISGVLASGVFSSSVVALSGTSAAAPQATRAIVDYLMRNPKGAGDPALTKQELLDGILGSTIAPDPRKGAGTLAREVATDRAGRLARRRSA